MERHVVRERHLRHRSRHRRPRSRGVDAAVAAPAEHEQRRAPALGRARHRRQRCRGERPAAERVASKAVGAAAEHNEIGPHDLIGAACDPLERLLKEVNKR